MRATRAVKRSATRFVQQQQRFVPAVQAKSPQLVASQLPNLFSRVSQQQSLQGCASGVCFVCGKSGHWRASCSFLQQANAMQSSRSLSDVEPDENENGISIWPDGNRLSKIVYSGAYTPTCGSFIMFEGNVFHRNWSDFERSQSSIYRELLTVSLSLKAFSDSLKGQSVNWFFGLRVSALKSLALYVFQSCLLNVISIDIQ